MKQKWKEGIAIIMTAAMLGCAVDGGSGSSLMETLAAEKADAARDYSADALQPDMTGNLNAQNYRTYGNLISSYLSVEGDGYMRVQFVPKEDSGSSDDLPGYEPKKDLLAVEYYDEQFRLKSKRYVDEENKLESLAGFYAGSDHYYVIWKQKLEIENWSADEVFMRVIQYDKNWQVQNRLDLNSNNSSLLGDGTSGSNGGMVNPCEAGSLNITGYGGHLYINSCYRGVDGHQRSMMFDIVESDMSAVRTKYSTSTYYASVSHSYNQFLLVDEEMSPVRMVALNHGDGLPYRGAALGQYELDTEYQRVDKDNKKEITAFSCAGGEVTDNNVRNYTGASLGGLERSATSYVVAGNSVKQDEETFLTAEQRNIFVTATARTDFSKENTKVYWLTDYAEDAEVVVSTPQLVKMSDNRILVMWREGKQIPHEAGTLMYRFLDADGMPLGKTKTAAGEITDCKPVVKDGKAVWYSSSADEGVYFYTIDSQGTFGAYRVNTAAGVPDVKKAEFQKDGVYLEWEPVEGADGYCIVRNQKPDKQENKGYYYVEVKTSYKLTYIEGGSTSSYLDQSEYTDGFPYEYRVCSYKICNGRKILSYGCDRIERWLFKGVQYFSALENIASGVKLSWKPYNPYFNPSEFRIYRSAAGESDARLIGTVKGAADRYLEDSVESFIDTTAEGGTAYDYSIETCRGEGVSTRFKVYSFVRVETPQVRAVCNPDNTVTVVWSKASGVEKCYLRCYIWNEGRKSYTMADPKQEMSADNLCCTVSGLQKGTKYQFGILGKSEFIQTPSMSGKYGFDSEEAKAEIVTCENPVETGLEQPVFVSAETTDGAIKLRWNPVEGADGYEIYAGQSAGSPESLTDTVYADENVAEGESCLYLVRAYVQEGETRMYSKWSGKSVRYQKQMPTATPTPTPTATPTGVATATPTPTPTAIPTAMPTPVPTTTPTATPRPTLTAMPNPDETASPTPTSSLPAETPDASPGVVSPSPLPTNTPYPTPINTVMPEQTIQPEPTLPPEQTVQPEPTLPPEQTVQPEPTLPPEQTIQPEPTLPPEQTVQPEPTPQPGPSPLPKPADEPEPAGTHPPTAESKEGRLGRPAIKKLKNRSANKVAVILSKRVDGADGYQVAYAVKSSMKGKKIKSFKGTGVTIKGLKRKKTYYFRVRAFVKKNGKTIYGSWGKKKRIKVRK